MQSERRGPTHGDHGPESDQAKKFNVTTDSAHAKPVMPDRFEQDCHATAPHQKWTSAITSVWTDEGWLYLAVVMDLYSRAIVGWSMHRRMTQPLVCDALPLAVCRHGFPKATIIHSDRSSQYCSRGYQQLIETHGLSGSMGRKATCYDHAVPESFFHPLKVKLVRRERYMTRRMAQSSIFAYMEPYGIIPNTGFLARSCVFP